jgi:hypothetical protein
VKARAYNLSSEHHEQVTLMQWVALHTTKYPALQNLYAVPNGGHRHIIIAAQMKAEGVKPGVPDLCLAYPSGDKHGLYIEMKKRVGGKLSDEQKLWRNRLQSCGYAVHVCAGWESAKDAIIQYLTPSK